ncbi:hypothetical protein AV530_016800 [Patagioenas fasciata monilis]|uniref:Uncharacterized protein n=1 Tax=Patagioenas fasciata monilis TaxID=372326 RepID=A0A1V4J3M7_PATFA|nr:hypothetical protein AV530_016800 [Patagioenas fasciata monilis]
MDPPLPLPAARRKPRENWPVAWRNLARVGGGWQITGEVTSNEWNKDKNVWGIYQYSFRIVSHLPGVPELRPSQSKQVFQVADLEVLVPEQKLLEPFAEISCGFSNLF